MMAVPGSKLQQELDEDAVFKEIVKVDDLIDDKGLELVKLSMYEELTQDQKDSKKKLSDLARCLYKRYDNPQDLLARFIYTLRMLGRRHYGHRAARNLEKALKFSSRFDNNMVPIKSKVERQRFLLYQHLVTACRLIPPESWDAFVHHCAKIKKLEINERMFTPCGVLVKLLHEAKLTCSNQEEFIEDVMVRAGISETIMEEYEKICIKIDSGDLSSRSTSRSRSVSFSTLKRHKSVSDIASTTTHVNYGWHNTNYPRFTMSLTRPVRLPLHAQTDGSAHQSPEEVNRLPPQVPVTNAGVDVDQPCPHGSPQEAVSRQLPSESANGTCTSMRQSSREGTGSEQPVVHDHGELPKRHESGKGKKIKICCTDICCCTLPRAFFIVALLLLMCGLAIYPSLKYEWKAPVTLKCQENTSVILADVHHFFTHSVLVTEDTKHIGDFYRDVDIYHLNLPCSSLPIRDEVTMITNFNVSSTNNTTFYALADSSIKFSICGRTNYTYGELERLELVLHTEEPQATGAYAIDFFHVGTDNEWECKESTLYLNEPGYYTIVYLPPTHPAEFTLNATYTISEIDFEQLNERALEANISINTLKKDQDSHTFSLDFRIARSCIVAAIRDNPSSLKENVHVTLKFLNQRIIIFITGGILSICTIIYFILLITCLLKLCAHLW